MAPLIKCWLAAEVWLASPFIGELWGSEIPLLTFDWHLNFYISVSVCVCVRGCARVRAQIFIWNQPFPYPWKSMWTNRGGIYGMGGCLPLFPRTASLKKMAHCITPYAGRGAKSFDGCWWERSKQTTWDGRRRKKQIKNIQMCTSPHTGTTAERHRKGKTRFLWLCLSTFTFSHPNFTSLSSLPPPPPCFLALNSSVQDERGLIVAQAHKQPYKGCVSDGKEAPGQGDGLFIGIQSPWAAIHINSSSLTSIPCKNKESGGQKPQSHSPSCRFNGQDSTEPNVASVPPRQPQPEPAARH